MAYEPVILNGRYVRLEPLQSEHVSDLAAIAYEPELWRWTTTQIHDETDLRAYVDQALAERERGVSLPFVIREQGTDRFIGSTRYGNIDESNRRVEIGWTWVAPPWQRSAVNTECKLLLLQHAFETIGCNRVEFKTDALNAKSRNALLGIGAVEEGILRLHMVTASGRLRDSVYYSIIAPEWPSVRSHLERRLVR